jgi:hypothetical protein
MTPSGIEPAIFRFVGQYLNRYATISGPHIFVLQQKNHAVHVLSEMFHINFHQADGLHSLT